MHPRRFMRVPDRCLTAEVDAGAGVRSYLIDAIHQQELKEALLAYFFVSQNRAQVCPFCGKCEYSAGRPLPLRWVLIHRVFETNADRACTNEWHCFL